MNGRERLMAVLTGKEPDRIPFAPLIGPYYLDSLVNQGITLEDIAPSSKACTPALRENENLWRIEIHRYIGSDCLTRHCSAYEVMYENCEKILEQRGNVVYSGYKTPIGTITLETVFPTETNIGNMGYTRKRLVETPQDMKILKYVMDHARILPDYQPFRELDAYIGEDGLVTVSTPVTPIQGLLQTDMGVEEFTYSLMDYEEEMEELMESIHRFNRRVYEVCADSPAQVFIAYEDTSTTVLSPAWYEKYCMRQIDEYADILHKKGKLFITHMCGKLANLTGYLAAGRQDGIDSVCPPTTGDLEPGKALEEVGKIIIGGLEPPALVRMNAKQAREYALEKLRQVGSGKGFILSTGDTTAADTPIENLTAIAELVKEKGAYPLNL